MTHLLTQIVSCMIIAVLVGMLIGWLLRNIHADRREVELNAQWKSELKKRGMQLTTRSRALIAAQDRADELGDELETANNTSADLRRELKARTTVMDSLHQELTVVRKRVASGETSLGEHITWIKLLQKKYRTAREQSDEQAARILEVEANKRAEIGELHTRLDTLVGEREAAHAARAIEVGGLRTQYMDLQARLKMVETDSSEQIVRLKRRIAELEPLTGELENQDTPLKRVIDRIRLVGTDSRTVLGRLNAQLRERHPAQRDVERSRTIVARLEQHVRTLEQDKADAEAQLQVRQAEIETLRAAAQQSANEAARLEAEVDSLDTSAAWFGDRPQLQLNNNAQMEARAGEVSRDADPDIDPDINDNLKVIHGIGPVLERTLNGLGITTFRQIALFSDNDIERIAGQLEVFPDRIRRDDWIAGAREAHFRKYGDWL